jgi:hypothetical protein
LETTNKNLAAIAAVCLLIGGAVGWMGASAEDGCCAGGACDGGSCDSGCCGAEGCAMMGGDGACPCCEDGKCPMMGGMGGMHMMPDGTMMANGDGMAHDMAAMTARLDGKTGDELDRIFLEDMIVHHRGAVDMAKLLEAGTNRPEMKKFAADIIRVQTAEIAQMEAWEKSWFGN